jgi:hypothetical protein
VKRSESWREEGPEGPEKVKGRKPEGEEPVILLMRLRDEMEDAGTAGAKWCVRDEMHGKNVECCGISRHREHAIE